MRKQFLFRNTMKNQTETCCFRRPVTQNVGLPTVPVVQADYRLTLFRFERSVINAALRAEYVDWNTGKFNETGTNIREDVISVMPGVSWRPNRLLLTSGRITSMKFYISFVTFQEIDGMGSLTEENYIKSIYSLSLEEGEVSVSELAKKLNVKLPTVNSMIKKLAGKKLVAYAPYQGIKLMEKGKKEALSIIRKHRLAELFLVKVMGMGWEEVHDIAEQLEHVNSERFYDRIDELLGYPQADPHGEPIPDINGKITAKNRTLLSDIKEGTSVKIVAVSNDEKSFLDHLNSKGLQIGEFITIRKKELFDGSMTIMNKAKKETMVSHQVAERIWVKM